MLKRAIINRFEGMARKHVVRVFRVKMSESMARKIDELIEEGEYVTYADAVRQALGLLLKKEKMI
jgi:Arc/MetJ-type ribon-helix-helix transcriptional regulator